MKNKLILLILYLVFTTSIYPYNHDHVFKSTSPYICTDNRDCNVSNPTTAEVANLYELNEYPQQLSYTTSDLYNSSSQVQRSSSSRKGIGDKDSGSETVWVDGYSATVSWSVESNFIGWRWWTITVNRVSQSFWGTFEEAVAKAKELARKEARKQAEEKALSVPIEDISIVLIIVILLCYVGHDVFKHRLKK